MPTFAIVTMGCQMNQHDSDRMSEVLEAAGYVSCPDAATADLIVLNTCSVREKAEHKLHSEVGRLAIVKRARPGTVLAVAGCVAQQEGARLIKRSPDIDVVIGPDNLAELPELVAERREIGTPQVRAEFDTASPSFLAADPRPGRQGATAFVTVMKGCNERCSFCIVPHTRGPERYRPAPDVVAEIARLVAAGVREVTLLGQTVNSYQSPDGSLSLAPGAAERPWTHTHPVTARSDESEFAALLRAIAHDVPDLLRLRYTSPHPRHLTMSLIRAHAELPVLARHVHLPVQSGSDRVLRRMARRYSIAEYEERIAALRREVPGVTLSTDMIVGFPGESAEDFDETLALVDRVGFTGLYGFKYSERPYTPARNLADDVPEADKAERLARLFALAEAQRRAHLASRVGTRAAVLAEGPGQGGGYTGRSGHNDIVHFGARRDVTGQIVDVTITRAFKNSLAAELSDPAERAPLARHAGAPRALPVVQGTPEG